MKLQNKITFVSILTIAFFILINVNDATHASPPNTPTCVAPENGDVFGESALILLKSSAFSDSDEDDFHYFTSWRIKRYDSDVILVDKSYTSNLTEITIDTGIENLAPGLKYIWQVQHIDYSYELSEWSDECTFKVGNTMPETLNTIKAGKSRDDFDMFSIVHYPDNPNPEEVYEINYDPQKYRIGTWDPEQDKYIEFGQGLVIEPGRAYWVLSRDDLDVSFDGIPVNMFYEIDVCLHTHPSTGMGWNMIAPPNAANYLWNEVKVGRFTDDVDPIIVDPVPITSPVASTLINHRIYEWQNGGYADHKLDENFVLEHYKGYWVKAIVEGAYLVFPEYAQVAGLSTPRNTMLAWKGKAVQWMKSLLPTPREAIADNDLPPMPMGELDGNTEAVFKGCFVDATGPWERSVR